MKDDRVYLLHIRDAIERIESYTAEGKEAFVAAMMAQDAVIRNLEIIGEAVKNLSAETRDRCLDIPWKQIAGMRDVLIHEYFGVRIETVWNVVVNRLPQLKSRVEALLAGPPEE
jgi:uncharacterized protein with HEPN domain